MLPSYWYMPETQDAFLSRYCVFTSIQASLIPSPVLTAYALHARLERPLPRDKRKLYYAVQTHFLLVSPRLRLNAR